MQGATNFEKTIICLLKLLNYYVIPLDRTNPLNAKSMSSAAEPNVLAIIKFLPIAAINRNNAEAIWLTNTSRRYSLNNLQYIHPYVIWNRTCEKTSLQVCSKLIIIITFLPSNIWVKSNDIVGNGYPHSNFY